MNTLLRSVVLSPDVQTLDPRPHKTVCVFISWVSISVFTGWATNNHHHDFMTSNRRDHCWALSNGSFFILLFACCRWVIAASSLGLYSRSTNNTTYHTALSIHIILWRQWSLTHYGDPKRAVVVVLRWWFSSLPSSSQGVVTLLLELNCPPAYLLAILIAVWAIHYRAIPILILPIPIPNPAIPIPDIDFGSQWIWCIFRYWCRRW